MDLPINAIHRTSGYKAEMFLLKPGDALRESGLQRRRLVDLGPALGEVYVHSPEDLILNKLRFYRISQQTKHVRDISLFLVLLAGLIGSAVMLRSEAFGKATAIVGLLANGIGLCYFLTLAFLPAIYWLPHPISAPFRVTWYFLIALKLFKLTRKV